MTNTYFDTETVYYDSYAEVDSSALSHVYHDSLTNTLYVQFRTGTIAGYANVPQVTYDDLVNASSVGSFYVHKIKSYFNGVNGDVNLVERPRQNKVPTPGSVRFEVVISIDGDLKLQVTAADLAMPPRRLRRC